MPECTSGWLICFLNTWGILFLPIIILVVMFFGGATVLGAVQKFRFKRTMKALDEQGVETEGMIIGKDIFHPSNTSYTRMPMARMRLRSTSYHAGVHRIGYIYTAGDYRYEAEEHVSGKDWVTLDRDAKVTIKYLPNKPQVSRLKDYTMLM